MNTTKIKSYSLLSSLQITVNVKAITVFSRILILYLAKKLEFRI